jgi:hypothetical protein
MRTTGAFIASLVVAFVLVSVLADKGSSIQRITGTVTEVHAGEWMLVANERTGLPVALRDTTRYEGKPAAIRTGIHVTVWYRRVAERRPLADKVRILVD